MAGRVTANVLPIHTAEHEHAAEMPTRFCQETQPGGLLYHAACGECQGVICQRPLEGIQ